MLVIKIGKRLKYNNIFVNRCSSEIKCKFAFFFGQISDDSNCKNISGGHFRDNRGIVILRNDILP